MARQPRTADTWRRTRTSGRESLRSSPGISSPTFFLFSSKRRHTIYWRDWSAGVCSSDLARLADRLRRDDADRLAVVDRGAPGQVTAVAGRADAVLRLADEHRADLHLLDAGGGDRLDVLLLDHRAGRHDDLAVRIDEVLGRRAAEDARGERGHDVAGVDDGANLDAALGAAVRLADDGVLRHVHETAGEVARVRRLERRVGKALAGAVRRVEVLEHVEAFLEVRDDRALDDLAGRLRHEAAHRRELLHLRRRAAGARVRHHVDRVHGLVAAGVVLLH